jgi:hypothetical protein
MGGGYSWANGSTLEFANGNADDWVGLVEKAYAQLNAQTSSGPLAMTFTESIQQLAQDNCSLYAASGRPVA